MPQLQPLRKHVARKRRPGESRLMTLQAPPWRTGQEAVTRGKTNHFLIQRVPTPRRSSGNALLFREFATFVVGKKNRNVGLRRTLRGQKR